MTTTAALTQIGAAAAALQIARDHCQRPLITTRMLDLACGKIEIAALLCPEYAQELLEIRERLSGEEADLSNALGEVEAIEQVLRGMTEGGEYAGAKWARELTRPQWFPIETAPKGKIILLFAVTDRSENGDVSNWKMATGSTPFAGSAEWTWDGYRLREWDVQPTHWMPLPLPPANVASGQHAGGVTDDPNTTAPAPAVTDEPEG